MEVTISKEATNRARELVHEAMGVIMRDIAPATTPPWRANIAIRQIVDMLEEQARVFELPDDLTIALFEVVCGVEPEVPEYIRKCHHEGKDKVHRFPAPEESQ